MNKNILGIIPARAGSKGVVGKNKRKVKNIPLIEYTINSAKESKKLTHIIISTDDKDIIKLAKLNDIEVIMRPKEISGDNDSVEDAVKHCLESSQINFDVIVLLQPTAPLRTSKDIDNSIDVFEKNDIRVCSVCLCEDNHPARMYAKKNGMLSSLFPEHSQKRRQDLPSIYHRNGAIYIFDKSHLYSDGIIGNVMIPYEMDAKSSVNIDSELDFLLFECLLDAK